jgi:hypothetical protein
MSLAGQINRGHPLAHSFKAVMLRQKPPSAGSVVGAPSVLPWRGVLDRPDVILSSPGWGLMG